MRLVLVFYLSLLITQTGRCVEFFVAPGGDDANPGSIELPFRTVERAVAVLGEGEIHEAAHIYLRGGTYFLSSPVVIQPGFDLPLTIEGYRDERVVVSGGVALPLQWEPFQDGIWKAAFPADFPVVDELYVGDERYRMARYPNYDPKAKFFGGTSKEAIAPERVKGWSHPAGGYIHALHEAMWGSKHYRIEKADPDGSLTLRGGWQENRGGGFDPDFRGGYHKEHLFVENIFEELDAPGEWYLDPTSLMLYAYPQPRHDLNRAGIIGAVQKQLFVVKGSMENPVRNVHIKNIHFQHTARIFMEPYERLLRGDWSIARLAAVHFEGTENCSITDCTFEKLGGNGVIINNYNRNARVEGCLFAELGESCVCIVGDLNAVRSPAVEYSNTIPQDEIDLTPGPKTENYPSNCIVHNNLMHDFGYVGKQTAGVFISMSEAITVSHNTIYDCPRAAVCINDGCWGGHVIEYNDAFNTVRESGDHGPLNSWGRDRFWKTSYNGGRDIEPFAKERALLDNYKTTHIRLNRFAHDGGHSWGIDLDDGSSNYRVYKNLCIGMGVKLREGFFRRVENNVIINGFGGFHVWFPGCDDVIARNIFVSGEPYQFIRANPAYADEFDHNLFYNNGKAMTITGVGEPMTMDEWKAKGFDSQSILADPLFVDAGNGDFRVQPESPALQLGFENFPMDRFGVVKPEFQTIVNTIPRQFGSIHTTVEQEAQRSAKPVTWLGAKIKNLTGEAEKSAAGMGEETGVLMIEVPNDSAAAKAGFKEGDVIIRWNHAIIHSLDDLTNFSSTENNSVIEITVFNAVERTVSLQMND